MPLTRPVYAPSFAPDALAATATLLYAGDILARGGATQKLCAMISRGHDFDDALEAAVNQGKGHIGELSQCASFSARSGSLGRSARASLSARANDATTDLFVTSSRRSVPYQIKVGTSAYAARTARNPKYSRVRKVVNAEALDDLRGRARPEARLLSDRVADRGTEAEQLSGERAKALVAEVITAELMEETPNTERLLGLALKSGMNDLVVSFASSLVVALVESAHSGETLSLKEFVVDASKLALKGAVRTTVQTGLLVRSYIASAKDTFCSKILHRVARSTFALGAVAEVVVEIAVDLLAAVRGNISLDDLLRRTGVHALAAAGSAVGASLAANMFRGEPWWVQLLAVAAAGYGGGVVGTAIGRAIFEPTPLALPQATAAST